AIYANENRADALVEIHQNSNEGTPYSGSEVFYSVRDTGKGRALAQSVLNRLVEFGFKNNGIKTRVNAAGQDAFAILRLTHMPAILAECAFINNPQDMAMFNVNGVARAIAEGVREVFPLEGGGLTPPFPSGSLQLGSVGEAVRQLQRCLNKIAGSYPSIPKAPENGVFGSETMLAVVAFQRLFGLTPDGVVGPITWNIMTPICGCGCGDEKRYSLTYLFGATSAQYLDMMAKTRGSLNTVCPDYFTLDASGNLVIAGADKLNRQFINAAHAQGIKVVPFISNNFNRELAIIALNNRENLSSQVARAVEDYGLDGVDVDIENASHEQRDMYTDFARLLRRKLPADKIVMTAVAANPRGFTLGWHGSYDYKSLSEYCDYLMIMNYDESFQGGPEGPVSSSGFFEGSIRFALDQGVPKEKIVSGIPFFGRYWKAGEAVGGIGLAARDVEFLIANYESAQYYDAARQSANVVVTIKPGEPEPEIWGGRRLTAGTYSIWYDSPRATEFKLETINRFGILGAGSWALGQEILSIWDFYSEVLNVNETEVIICQK
ncbi:MAG: glycosyl hydrolase family 18 protein, partial [Defluviitaleaceae bacterium]|nr:glycosyl hydrolase family 18 protein [Defluviitaleaceae bacterium]